jgi:hypothetical protein
MANKGRTLQEQLAEIRVRIKHGRFTIVPAKFDKQEVVERLLRFKSRIQMVDSGQLRLRMRTLVEYQGHRFPSEQDEDDERRLYTVPLDAFSMCTEPETLLQLCEEMMAAGDDAGQFLIDLFSKAR